MSIRVANSQKKTLPLKPVTIGNGNGNTDKGHHPRLRRLHLINKPLEKRIPPVKEDDGGKDKEDIQITGESDGLRKTQKALNHG
jgi:hypothetical protein